MSDILIGHVLERIMSTYRDWSTRPLECAVRSTCIIMSPIKGSCPGHVDSRPSDVCSHEWLANIMMLVCEEKNVPKNKKWVV